MTNTQPVIIPEAKLLKIATESQADNMGGGGYRECFSSTCGAIARYWGAVASDDAYNTIRREYGDTTNPQAQILALRSLGLQATFTTAGTIQALKNEIAAGRPVAVGWIHHGSIDAPVGNGHWSVVAGYDATRLWFMDPNGEADILRGGYQSTGKGWQGWYTIRNWRRRWELTEGMQSWIYKAGNGWMVTVKRQTRERENVLAA